MVQITHKINHKKLLILIKEFNKKLAKIKAVCYKTNRKMTTVAIKTVYI